MSNEDGNNSKPPAPDAVDAGPSNWVLVRRMLGLSWRYRGRCLAVLLLEISLVVMTVGGLGLAGLGIDFIRHSVDPSVRSPRWPLGLAPPADWRPVAVVAVIAAGVLLLALVHTVLRYRAAVSEAKLVQSVVIDLRSAVYDKLQRLSFRFFDGTDSGSIINRVTGDVQAVRHFVDGVIIQVLTVVMSLAIYLGYMLSIHVKLTLACLATTPVLWFGAIMFSRTVRPAYRQNRLLFDKMIRTLTEYLRGVHVVKCFGRQREQVAQFHADNAAVRDQKHWIFWRISLFVPAIFMVAQLNVVVLLGYGGYLVIHGALPLGTGLIVFAGLLTQFSSLIGQIAHITNSVQVSLIGAGRVFEILDEPVEITSPAAAVRLPRAQGRVRFERVSFAYRGAEPVLHEIDLAVEPGQCVAIVGATGAGKSTLLSLIPRFYDATAGRVLIDEIDVRELDLDDLRRNVGIVFQESFLFSNTAAANIAFGHPGATMAQVEQAARVAAAHEFIMELPQGYDTVIGENGVDLSGGQRQRLAIARAVLLEPPILLLDDATAAVDPETEHEIMAAMDNAMRGRTTFVIAHRISTLRRADHVIVLERGRIVQRGTHEELMHQSGHYRRAARLQVPDDQSVRVLDAVVSGE